MINRCLFATMLTVLLLSVTACAGRMAMQADRSSSGQETTLGAPTESRAGTDERAQVAGKDEEILKLGQQNAGLARKNVAATAEYHFSMAQAYSAEGNPDRAIEEYKLTLMFDPDSALVYARIASEYVKKGALSSAMEACKEALQRDPKYTDARLMLAGLYSVSHDVEKALSEYSRILKQNPKHEEAAVYKAQVLIENDRQAEAGKYLKTFLKASPESALAWFYLGQAEQRQDHFEAAAVAYKKSIDIRPFAQGSLALGFLYEEKGLNKQATEIYQDLYDRTQDLTAANRLATVYLKQEKYEKAIPYLKAIEQSDPEDLNSRVKLGLVYMELKKFDLAMTLFKDILAKHPDSDRIHYYLGSVYEEIKQLDDAIRELKAVSAESKLFADAALHVAYLYKMTNRVGESKTYIKEAITKSPRVPGFYLFQASLEEDGKNIEGAIAVLEGAMQKFPEDEKVHYYLGTLYDRQGDTDKSLVHMETILKVNPNNVDALNYLGYTWAVKGVRLGDAERVLRKALTLKPDNGYVQDSWGWYLFVRGRTSEAVVELEKAAKMRPNEATILEHLADAYLKSNLREKALEQYREAVRYAQETTVRDKIQEKLGNLQKEMMAGNTKTLGEKDRSPASH